VDFVYFTVISLCVYVLLVSSLNVVMGTAGLFSVASAALAGVGAYTSSILDTRYGVGSLGAVLAAMGLATAASVAIGLFSLRLVGSFLMVGSFSIQILAQYVFLNWRGFTGGDQGIAAIPYPVVLGVHLSSVQRLAIAALLVTVLAVGVLHVLDVSPFGRLLRAVRDDADVARSLGKHVLRARLSAFAIQGAFSGLAGAIYAYYIHFVNSSQFTTDLSILVIMMVVLGGAGSTFGGIVGAVALGLVPVILSYVRVSSASIGLIQQMVYGLALLAVVFLRPEGLIPEGALRRPGLRRRLPSALASWVGP
jgi:branched-chain amino acid transport system permease protein